MAGLVSSKYLNDLADGSRVLILLNMMKSEG